MFAKQAFKLLPQRQGLLRVLGGDRNIMENVTQAVMVRNHLLYVHARRCGMCIVVVKQVVLLTRCRSPRQQCALPVSKVVLGDLPSLLCLSWQTRGSIATIRVLP